MSITTEFTSSTTTTKTNQTDTGESIHDMTNGGVAGGNNKTLIIVLAVTLPTLVCIGLIIILILCYRRRQTTIWLKKLDNSSQLQAIVVNLSPNATQSPYETYSEKKPRISYRQYFKPRTETIVYKRLSTPSTPVVFKPFKSPTKGLIGETNVAFDEYFIKNEEQPILKSDQDTTILHTDFPVSLHAPVPTITSAFVEAIANHRLSLLTDRCETSSSNSRQSGVSPAFQTVLLFSQRTQF